MDISKHPVLRQIYELCLAIEECGASPELTNAVTKCSAVMLEVERLVDKLDEAKTPPLVKSPAYVGWDMGNDDRYGMVYVVPVKWITREEFRAMFEPTPEIPTASDALQGAGRTHPAT